MTSGGRRTAGCTWFLAAGGLAIPRSAALSLRCCSRRSPCTCGLPPWSSSCAIAGGAAGYPRIGVGLTLLAVACVQGHLATVRFRVERGANPNRPVGILARTPLMSAVEMGHPEVVEYLLKAGADVSVSDKEGRTALQMAREKDRVRSGVRRWGRDGRTGRHQRT